MGKESNKQMGALGESIAARYLESRGYLIAERNVSLRGAEIDIVAEKDGITHLIEVKTISRESRQGEVGYRPEELVHREKVRKIWTFGQHYLISREMGDRSTQIDVVAVEVDAASKKASCRLIEHVEELLG